MLAIPKPFTITFGGHFGNDTNAGIQFKRITVYIYGKNLEECIKAARAEFNLDVNWHLERATDDVPPIIGVSAPSR